MATLGLWNSVWLLFLQLLEDNYISRNHIYGLVKVKGQEAKAWWAIQV